MTKPQAKKAKKPVAKTEKFEPTKMSLAVAAAAATTLTLFAVIATSF
jgi:hypothetical protein